VKEALNMIRKYIHALLTKEVFVERKVLEQVNKFKYLGVWITEDGRSEIEVKSRIVMAKAAFNDRKELLTKNIK